MRYLQPQVTNEIKIQLQNEAPVDQYDSKTGNLLIIIIIIIRMNVIATL